MKRDAEDRVHTVEDETRRGIYFHRSGSEKITISDKFDSYLSEVTPTEKASTQNGDKDRARQLKSSLSEYSIAALNSDIVAKLSR